MSLTPEVKKWQKTIEAEWNRSGHKQFKKFLKIKLPEFLMDTTKEEIDNYVDRNLYQAVWHRVPVKQVDKKPKSYKQRSSIKFSGAQREAKLKALHFDEMTTKEIKQNREELEMQKRVEEIEQDRKHLVKSAVDFGKAIRQQSALASPISREFAYYPIEDQHNVIAIGEPEYEDLSKGISTVKKILLSLVAISLGFILRAIYESL